MLYLLMHAVACRQHAGGVYRRNNRRAAVGHPTTSMGPYVGLLETSWCVSTCMLKHADGLGRLDLHISLTLMDAGGWLGDMM